MALSIDIAELFEILIESCDDDDKQRTLRHHFADLEEQLGSEGITFDLTTLQEHISSRVDDFLDPEKLHRLVTNAAYSKDGYKDLASYLAKAKYHEIDLEKDDLAYITARKGFISNLRVFKEYGADMHANDESILRTAALYGHKDIVLFLLNECDADPRKLIGCASYSNHSEIEKILDLAIANQRRSLYF